MREEFFSYQQIGEDYAAYADDIRRGTPTAVFGVSDSLKYLLAGMTPFPVLYVTADGVSARKAAENIASLSGKRTEILAAKDEVLLYRKALSKDSLFKRLNGIYALQQGCPVLTAEIDALLQLFPKKLPTLRFTEGEDFDFGTLSQQLTQMGYTRAFEVESKGVFALRGDILDIYPVNAEQPVRIDFFGDTVEKIKPYDLVTGERLPNVASCEILSATDVLVRDEDKPLIRAELMSGVKSFKTAEAYARARDISDELLSDENCDNAYLLPLLKNSTDIFSVLPQNTVVIFDEGKTLWDKFNALYKEHEERFHRLQTGGEAFDFCRRQYVEKDVFLEGVMRARRVAMQTFTGNPFFFQPLKIYNFSSTPTTRYLNGMPALLTDIRNWRRGGYRVMLYCGENARSVKMAEQLSEDYLSTVKLPDR